MEPSNRNRCHLPHTSGFFCSLCAVPIISQRLKSIDYAAQHHSHCHNGSPDQFPRHFWRRLGIGFRFGNGFWLCFLLNQLVLQLLCHCRGSGTNRFSRPLRCWLGLGLWFRFVFWLRLRLRGLVKQALFQFLHALGALLGRHCQSLLQGGQGGGGQSVQTRQVPGNSVFLDPIHSGRRELAGEGEINRCGHGIYVRPGAGAAPLGVLLEGTEPTFRHLHGGRAGVHV